jgi:hypothetical protein
MKTTAPKPGAPGLHQGRMFRFYIRGNLETRHGHRELHFVSPLMNHTIDGIPHWNNFPALIMLEAYRRHAPDSNA